jgi:hypothetical protein
VIGHFLIVMTRDVKGPVGIIFDMTFVENLKRLRNFVDIGKFGVIGPAISKIIFSSALRVIVTAMKRFRKSEKIVTNQITRLPTFFKNFQTSRL